MLIDEEFDCIEGSSYAGADVALESSESKLFSEPSDNAEVALVISFPFLSYYFIPFFKCSYVGHKLVIFRPFFYDLQCVKCFRDALDECRGNIQFGGHYFE